MILLYSLAFIGALVVATCLVLGAAVLVSIVRDGLKF